LPSHHCSHDTAASARASRKAFTCLQLMETLNEINERHEAVKELNKSLLELHQMFLDMAVLVEQQGVMLDNIERQVQILCKRLLHLLRGNASCDK
jgi:t-SNARE complex subunit (syntaxin)